jgi:hypothetical protein
MLEILGKLLGSVAKVKLMRLFLLNQEGGFDLADIKGRTGLDGKTVGEELRRLASIGFISKKIIRKEVLLRGKKQPTSKRVSGYVFNQSFRYREALYNLLIDTEFVDYKDVSARFKKAGKVKLLVLSGLFVKNAESPVDILIVGDNVNQNIIEKSIRQMESEIGKELTYALFETAEFLYRASMYDKLVREIIDSPFIELIDARILQQVPKITPRVA